MLECQNCGAVGDAFFSENYFGEMVCELCGTQSFLQARNETQDAEDMCLDVTTIHRTLRERVSHRKKRQTSNTKQKKPKEGQKETPTLPPLLDCVLATQMVLDAMARALVKRVGSHTFPAEAYPKAVKELWFKFLKTWGVKGTKPLLRCYNEFFLYYTKEEEKTLDPAVTLDLLEQWDAEWEVKRMDEDQKKEEQVKREEELKLRKDKERKRPKKKKYPYVRARMFDTLSKFSIVDMIGILMLASRVLNLGLLPSDFADWVATGVIPYHNSLATCCSDVPDVRDSVKFIAGFFQSLMKRHKATAVHIAYSAHHLQYQMGLRLPPLNVPLAVHRLCATMGFPGEVYRNFQWITGFMNVKGELPELPLMLQAEVDGYPRFKLKHSKKDRAKVETVLESEIDIVAHLVVAIKMCANWHEWIYERQHSEGQNEGDERKAPPVIAVHDAHLLPRRDLDAYAQFARQIFIDPDKSGVLKGFKDHVGHLERISRPDELSDTQRGQSKGLKQNDVYAYPAIHVDGILAETDSDIEERMKRLRSQENTSELPHSNDGEHNYDAFFYPVFCYRTHRTALHPVFDKLLEMLCRKINAPMGSVFYRLAQLDRRMESLIYHFERTKFHVGMLKEGRAKWNAIQDKKTTIHASSPEKKKRKVSRHLETL